MLTTALAFVVVLGIIIFVHEFGHLITAKAFGMRVFIFSFGFGRRLVGFKWGDTDCRISLVPLGGYVKLEGEPEDHLSEDTSTLGDGRDFTNRPRWQRFLVYLAGPVMNAALTIGVLTLIFLQGSGEVDATFFDRALIGSVESGSPAQAAGLKAGDEILSIDGQPIHTWEDALTAIMLRPDSNIVLGIRREGREITVPIRSTVVAVERVGHIGVSPMMHVGKLTPGMPAEKAGLQTGDGILRIGDKPVRSFEDVLNAVKASGGTSLRFSVYREPDFLDLEVTPVPTSEGFRIGLGPKTLRKAFGLRGALVEACATTWQQTKLTFEVLERLLTARLSPRTMMGPLGIAQKSGEEARRGAGPFFSLVAMISLQVGLLNLFPLAPLDGGHLAILASEGILQRDFSVNVKTWIMNAGAFVIFLLVFVVLYSDLSKTSFGRFLP